MLPIVTVLPMLPRGGLMPKITKADIENWVETTPTGEFHYKTILGLGKDLTVSEDNALRKMVSLMCHDETPVIETVGKNDGFYRRVENCAALLDWQTDEERVDSGLVLPFNLRKWAFIYPDTTSVVAGSKSSGKTGFLYRVVVLNMYRKHVLLLTNLEGGISMLRDRFYAMDIEIPKPAPFDVKFVHENYHDYITQKDTLYIIDYIDVPDDGAFYMIGGKIKKIDNKLHGKNSEAFVGLQKSSYSDTAYGGEQTLKSATLYLAMNKNKLKIVDAKVHADKNIDPNNMQWTFTYEDEGTRFTDITPYYGE